VDHHGLLKVDHTILGKGSMAIVLLHMGSAVLVKIEILAVATLMQFLKVESMSELNLTLSPPKK
jgi:hypothetical protein